MRLVRCNVDRFGRRWATACALVGLAILTNVNRVAAAQIEITLAVAGNAPLEVQKRWHQTLTESPAVSVRLRKSTESDAPSQQATGAGDNRVVRVLAVVDGRGNLTVPGGRFAPNERQRARQWLADLIEEPAPPPGESPADRDKQAVLEQLAKPVDFTTVGRDRWEVVGQLRRESGLTIDFDAAAQARVPRGADRPPDSIADEFKGVAVGTSLAAVLRPIGLGLRVRAGAHPPLLAIVVFDAPRDVWPVGQPVTEGAKQTLPELFEFFSAELDDVPLERVLGSVGSRLRTRVLWDRLAIERAGVDPSLVRVTFPPRRTAYMMLLREVLRKAELRYELRTDDANKPFLWITSKLPWEMLEAKHTSQPRTLDESNQP